MKKFAKRAAALLLAVILTFSLAGCYSADMTWAARMGDTELPIGGYIYYLSVGYNQASYQIPETDKVLDSEIDGVDAETWIRNWADDYTNRYFWIEQEMDRFGLSLSEKELSDAQQDTNSYWSYVGDSSEEYGVSKNSVNLVYAQYNQKYLKVFEAYYGEGGEREIPEEDLLKQYRENYYNYEYFAVPTVKLDDEGESVEMTEDEIADLKSRLEKTAAEIKAGTVTTLDASNVYAEEVGEASSYVMDVDNVSDMQNAYLPANFIETVTTMAEGDTALVEAYGYVLLIHLLPIDNTAADVLAAPEGRMKLMTELKNTEFAEFVSEAASTMEGIERNEKAIARYKPSMFKSTGEYGRINVAEETEEDAAE